MLTREAKILELIVVEMLQQAALARLFKLKPETLPAQFVNAYAERVPGAPKPTVPFSGVGNIRRVD